MVDEDNPPPGIALIFVIPFCLFGFGFAYPALSAGLHSRDILKTWRVVPAKVLSRSVKEAFPHDPDTNPTWRASVVYEYEVGGRRYQCDHVNVRWNEGKADPAPSEDLMIPYVPGKEVFAYVNPSDPSDALLDATPMVPWLWLFVGFAMATVALLFGFVAYGFSNLSGRRTAGRVLLGFLWILFSAIGLACSAISGVTPVGVWIATILHAVIGVFLAAWQLRPLTRRLQSKRG